MSAAKKTRKESDYLGSVNVPADAYYGAQTERAVKNFPISGIRFPAEFIKSYAVIKKSAAIANARARVLDKRKSAAIVKACDEVIQGKLLNQFVVDIYQAGAGTSTNMNLNEVIANRAITILKGSKGDYKMIHPHDDVNKSQSTNDTFHSAVHITTLKMLEEDLIPALEEMSREFHKKAKKFSKIIKPGRTHLMNAAPISLGQEFGGYAVTIDRSVEYLRKSMELLYELNIGGTAMGTGINAPKGFSGSVLREINRATKRKFTKAKDYFAATQNTTAELQVSGALRMAAVSVIKISGDIRLMSSGPISGFREITLPPVQPGSSIMPSKINPSMAEMLEMVAYQVIGNDTTIAFSTKASQFEINVMMPVIAYNLLHSIEILAHAVTAFTRKAVVGIKPNVRLLKEISERNPFAATALVPYIGFDEAASVVREVIDKDRTIVEVVLRRKLMDRKKLEKILKRTV